MSNRGNPHGLLPTGRTIEGGEPHIEILTKDAAQATAIFTGDVVNREADDNIAPGGTPGTTTYTGVSLSFGAALSLSTHVVVTSPGALFVVQVNNDTDGIAAADPGSNVNFEFNPGSPTTLISGHELDESSINTTASLDAKILRLWDKPDNAYGANGDMVIMFNKHRNVPNVAGV